MVNGTERLEGEAQQTPWRFRVALLAKLALSLGLLAFAALQIDLRQAAAVIAQADPVLLVVALAALLLQPVLGTWRWRNIIHALHGRLPFADALRFLFIGTFFNQVLPGAVVGDGLRAILARGTGLSWRQAVHSVLVDRLAMFGMIVLFVLAAEPWLAARLGYAAQPWLLPAALGLMAVGLLVLALPRQLLGPLYRLHRLGFLRDLIGDARRLFLKPGPAFLLLLTCALSYANLGVVFWLVGLALDLGLPGQSYLFLVPPIILASILPISVGGWGVRETAALTLLTAAGAAAPQALAVSVTFGLVSLAVGLPGLLFWLTDRARKGPRPQPDDDVA